MQATQIIAKPMKKHGEAKKRKAVASFKSGSYKPLSGSQMSAMKAKATAGSPANDKKFQALKENAASAIGNFKKSFK